MTNDPKMAVGRGPGRKRPAGGLITCLTQFTYAFFTAFPDLQTTIEDLIAEGDKVAVRQTWELSRHFPDWQAGDPYQP
jgi:hypothetical protein